jgi:hypothetical protein
MHRYSGSTSFDFEIERWKDRDSGDLLSFEEVPDVDDDFEYEYQVISLKIEGNSYFIPGRFYGPPDSCYPDEGETEMTKCLGPDGQDWTDLLTKEEYQDIIDEIETHCSED